MNPVYITKIAKHTLIGSVSACLSFVGKYNPNVRLFLVYVIGGIVATVIVAALWEARDYLVASEPTEEQLSTLIGGLTNNRPEKRKYYLPAQVRLEIVVTVVVIVVSALIGTL